MGSLHVYPTQILALDLHEFIPPPPLVDPIHDPLRDSSLAHVEPLPDPNPQGPQPLQLLRGDRQLRDRRCGLLGIPLRGWRLRPLPPPQLPEPRNGGARPGRGDRALRRAPARVEGGADAVAGDLVRCGDEDLAGGAGAGGGGAAIAGFVGEVAKAAELVGDALNGGFG